MLYVMLLVTSTYSCAQTFLIRWNATSKKQYLLQKLSNGEWWARYPLIIHVRAFQSDIIATSALVLIRRITPYANVVSNSHNGLFGLLGLIRNWAQNGLHSYRQYANGNLYYPIQFHYCKISYRPSPLYISTILMELSKTLLNRIRAVRYKYDLH